MKAIRIAAVGGPEVLDYVDHELPPPAPGEVRVRNHAIGVNFGESYYRSGLYGVPALPSGMGSEAAGVVEALGDGVTDFRVGERVAYGEGVLGSYAEATNIAAHRLVRLPDDISFEVAAASVAKGLTTQMLIRQTFRVEAGQTILLHAAAGGVGVILAQWAASLGARVIGTVGSDDKIAYAKPRGCAEVLNVRTEDWVARVRALTGGAGVPVVYDSTGADTFIGSLDCLAPRGMMVSYGNSSGKAPAIEPLALMMRGSLFLTRPFLAHYMVTAEDTARMSADLFAAIASGAVKIEIGQRFALSQAREVHELLASRKTVGATVMIP